MIDGYGTTNLIPAMRISKRLGRKQIERKFYRQITVLVEAYKKRLIPIKRFSKDTTLLITYCIDDVIYGHNASANNV